MSRKSIYLVVFLATISLIGIIVTQIFWVDKAFAIKEREFNDRTVIALTSVVERIQALNKDSSDVDEPVVQETSNYFVAHVNDTLHPYLLESLLKEEFQASLLKQNFEYVIYDCFNDSIVFGSKVNLDQPDNIVKSEDVTPQKKLNRDGHYFGVYFPKKKGYLMDQMGIWMFNSIIILLVVVFFAYSIMAILKQKRLSEIKTDFINNMTHELKTPISTISLSTGALLNLSDIKSVKKYAQIIKTENERLQNQVERVLDIATLSPNKLKLDKKDIHLHQLLEEINKSLELKLKNVNGQLNFNFNAKSDLVSSDKLHLTNVFTNLIDNAIKYCKVSPKIVIQTSTSNNKIIVVIEDNGMGIEKKHHSMIFEKFFRVPSGDRHDVKGFGLGLFYVKSVLDALDGTIKLIKSDRTGSTFKLELQQHG